MYGIINIWFPYEVKILIHKLVRHPLIIQNGQMSTSKWKVVPGALDRVNIPCIMHDTLHRSHLCIINVASFLRVTSILPLVQVVLARLLAEEEGQHGLYFLGQ